MDDREASAAQRLQREPVRNPRRETDHGLDRRLDGGLDRDGAAHGEPEQERPGRAGLRTAARVSAAHQSIRFHDLIR